MNPIPIRYYRRNSPQALSRVLFMLMIADGALGRREVDALARLRAFELLGIKPEAFAKVARSYCSDLLNAEDANGRIRIFDPERIDTVLEAVDDPDKRLLVCALALNVLAAEDRFSAHELNAFQYVIGRWNLNLDEMYRQLLRACEPTPERSAPMPMAA